MISAMACFLDPSKYRIYEVSIVMMGHEAESYHNGLSCLWKKPLKDVQENVLRSNFNHVTMAGDQTLEIPF